MSLTPDDFTDECYHGTYELSGAVEAQTIHHDAVTEQVWVVDKAAWTETINHPVETHIETVHHEEVGHWE